MDKLMTLCEAMIHYDRGDAKRIHHFLKVHAFAKQIGLEEGLDAETQFILEAAAYVHDIGIHQGEIKYGRNDGMIQQELGPKEALPMLKRLHFTQAEIDRILWLIAHHHSYGSIDGPDAQILAEADMLVNQFEDGASDEQNKALYHRLYKTETGKRLFRERDFDTYDPGKK